MGHKQQLNIIETSSTDSPKTLSELRQELAQTKAQLEQLQKEYDQFTYVISHDLRGPVRHINGYAELLARKLGSDMDESGQEFLQFLKTGAQSLNLQIHAILTFSRLGREKITPESIDTEAHIKQIFQTYEMEIEERGIVVEIEPLPPLISDLAMFRKIWDQLISNAVRFSANAKPPYIKISATSDDDLITFSIQDNGMGFDPADADKLFKFFSRLHTEEDCPDIGLGMGLVFVKKMVSRLGGKVWAESEQNNGAKFFLQLPISLDIS